MIESVQCQMRDDPDTSEDPMALCRSVATVVLIVGSLFPIVARGSTWRLISVAQPLLDEGFVSIWDVPYGEGSFVPGAEVNLTCEPNAIRMVGEELGGGTENRNAASRFGLAIEAGRLSNEREFFDTLTVTLDATHADSAAAAQGLAAPDGVIEATVMCLRINAERFQFQRGIPLTSHQTKYLRLRVLGPERMRRFARVYKIAPLPLPGRVYDLGPRPEH